MTRMAGLKMAAASLSLLGANIAAAAIAWDETVDGELSSDPAAPTAVAFADGVNTVNGAIGQGDVRDYFTFTIPDGQQLVGVLLQSYVDLDTGGDGDRGWYSVSAGSTSAVPAFDNPNEFLGGTHLDPQPAGTDILALLITNSLTGTGVTGPLGAGTYTWLVQQTGAELGGYSLDFVVAPVPVPAAFWLMASGMAGLAGLRRRR